MATFSSGVKCFRSFLIRSLRYLNGRTLSPFPTEARHLLVRQHPDELDCAFVAPFQQADFFRTSKLLVPRRSLDGVPERPRGERREFYRIVALDTLLGSQLQARSRIVAGLRDPSIQRKELHGADKDSL